MKLEIIESCSCHTVYEKFKVKKISSDEKRKINNDSQKLRKKNESVLDTVSKFCNSLYFQA